MTFRSPFKSPFCQFYAKSLSYDNTLRNYVTWKMISAGGVCFAFRLTSLSRYLNILKTKSPNSKVLYSSKSTKDIFDWKGGSFK